MIYILLIVLLFMILISFVIFYNKKEKYIATTNISLTNNDNELSRSNSVKFTGLYPYSPEITMQDIQRKIRFLSSSKRKIRQNGETSRELTQTCKSLWIPSSLRYLYRMTDGNEIPQELRDRIESECSCGHQCQYINSDQYYYLNHDKKGWEKGSRRNDIGNCFTSARIRTYGGQQLNQCNVPELVNIDTTSYSTFIRRRPVGKTFSRRTDLDEEDVYP